MRSKTIKKIIAAAVVAAMGITSIVPAAPAQAAAKTKKLTVKTKKITLYKGAAAGYGSMKLKVTVKPKKAKVTYKINKKKIASVSKKGVVKAKKPGKAKITVKSGSKKVVVKVVVKKIKKKVTKVTAPKNVTVKVGAKQKIKTAVKPKKATLKKLTFKSSAKKIAKVNAKGVITGVKAGKAKITVKAVDGSKKKATVSVVVTAGAVATSPAITTGPAVTAKVAPSATVAPTTNVPATNAPATTAPAETTAPALKPVEVPELADGESYKVTFGKDTLNVSKDDIEAVASAFNQKADKIKANLAKDLAEKANNFIAKAYDSKTASVAVKGLTYSKEAGSDTVYVEKNGKKVAVKTTVKDDVVSVAATGDKNFSLDVKGSAKECTVSNVVIGGEKFEGTFAVATEISDDNTVTITVADTAKLVVDKNGNIKELSVAEKYAKDLKISK
ncbi:carbohydrate binding domain protein [Clostridium sp. CAG:277]|nr:carbohydrate binding domain protein [Clostridium sp. CAG:277]